MSDFNTTIRQLAERHRSFYIYRQSMIEDNIQALKSSFKNAQFLYSVKTNPFEPVLKTVVRQGLGFDAASLNEVLMGEKLGLARDKIYYSAPGKTRDDIVGAAGRSVIIADSLNELEMLQSVAKETGKKLDTGIRINPDFTLGSESGVSSKFGIDYDILKENIQWINSLDMLNITGIHVHSRSQELNRQTLARYYENMLKLAVFVKENLAPGLKFVNMGGGLGIPYSCGQRPLDIHGLGRAFDEMAEKFLEQIPGVKIFIESGRYIAGKAGTYVTTVLDKKVSMGKTYVILHNTLNGFIRPSLAMLVEAYANGNLFGSEPLYTQKDAFEFSAPFSDGQPEQVTLCGNLCTATDVVAKDITLPALKPGDIITISNAGSYAAVLSPMQFASLPAPAQIFFTSDGLIK